jgi:hypothetical protein
MSLFYPKNTATLLLLNIYERENKIPYTYPKNMKTKIAPPDELPGESNADKMGKHWGIQV